MREPYLVTRIEVWMIPNGIPVDGSWRHPTVSNSLGKYFKYDPDQWAQYFGPGTGTFDVKQCRDGAKVWEGEVIIWPDSDSRHNGAAIGRRNPSPLAGQGQWEKHDYVVKVCAYCDD